MSRWQSMLGLSHAPVPRRRLYAVAGAVGLIGCLAAIIGDVAGVAAADLSLLQHSISRSAAGDHALIVDVGLCLFAVGVAGVAAALYHWNLGDRFYRIGAMLLAVCALAIFLLAAWNGYDRKNADDFGLHMMFLYVLAALFPLCTFLLSKGLGRAHVNWRRFTVAVGALWIASGPIYYFMPDNLKGLFERATMMLIVAWIAGVSVLLIRKSRA